MDTGVDPMVRVAVLTCVLGFAALALGACVYEPGPYASYPARQYGNAPSYGRSFAPYNESDPTVLRYNEGALGGQ
jgi:hypothetical protein